ncbi:MAG: type II toxin-antitoxin system RelE/ParE family toxin [Deltaproteobacteria bacterium]|nr:type II toxin-antitoxin system RelE/ParE family toxin [Candidatus Anaeroferrophillacea bacterium]
METEIKWHKRTLKQLAGIPLKDRTAIVNAVKALPGEHGGCQVKSLANHDYGYRLRVGRYRVFFDIELQEVKIHFIQEVKKRDERTY